MAGDSYLAPVGHSPRRPMTVGQRDASHPVLRVRAMGTYANLHYMQERWVSGSRVDEGIRLGALIVLEDPREQRMDEVFIDLRSGEELDMAGLVGLVTETLVSSDPAPEANDDVNVDVVGFDQDDVDDEDEDPDDDDVEVEVDELDGVIRDPDYVRPLGPDPWLDASFAPETPAEANDTVPDIVPDIVPADDKADEPSPENQAITDLLDQPPIDLDAVNDAVNDLPVDTRWEGGTPPRPRKPSKKK